VAKWPDFLQRKHLLVARSATGCGVAGKAGLLFLGVDACLGAVTGVTRCSLRARRVVGIVVVRVGSTVSACN
jgi:hypothetical protein